MAGHSRWKNIKHKKAASDAKRGKLWSKCAKAIMVAARAGGADPVMNLGLRYAIDEARYANMPRDTIERAIKKGAGELGGDDFEPIRYEGYGPGGVAVVVEALTNNRTRTATDVRNAFNKCGGNLGTTGCVSYLFETKGIIQVSGAGVEEDRIMEAAVSAGAEDVTEPDDAGGDWTVSTNPADFHAVKEAMESGGLTITDAKLDMIPSTTVTVAADDAKQLLRLVDMLEDNDDVQKVYANFEVPDDVLAAIQD